LGIQNDASAMKSFLFRFITPIQEQMMSDKNRNTSKYQLTIGLLFAAIAGLWLSSTNTYNDNNRQVVAQQDNSVIRVAAGGGNSTDVKTVFIPQNIEIQAGQSINWNNPTPVGEPHSVTFFKDTNQFPPFLAPFSVPASTEFNSLMPSSNLEPLTVTNNDTATKTVVVANARSLSPIVVDSTSQNVTYLPINANYTMDGTERYLNSGWIWPVEQNPPEAPPITDFTVTFENPGTYGYVCVVHPWMTGSVVVR
jgi:plastocyanin